MKALIKFLASRIGPIMVVGLYFVVLITFLVAYTSPNKNTLVTINEYNEADLELALLLLTLPLTLPFAYKSIVEGSP